MIPRQIPKFLAGRTLLQAAVAALLLLPALPASAQTCDFDGDGVPDHFDNCPLISNASQANIDGDPIGDDCDPVNDFDYDADGVDNVIDNCPLAANALQSDADADGNGDTCDYADNRDVDEDGVFNDIDNCPVVLNPGQLDVDGDGIGDPCDPLNDLDYDSDDIPNSYDNCPLVANTSQANGDSDFLGDACDPTNDLDYDADGVVNELDNCALDPNAAQTDADGDGVGDICDAVDGLLTDEHQCYKVKDLKLPPFAAIGDVSLVDALSSANADVLKLGSVCAPVNRAGLGIVDPADWRCCYKLKTAKLDPARDVLLDSSLQNSTVEAKKAATLCTPCTATIAP